MPELRNDKWNNQQKNKRVIKPGELVLLKLHNTSNLHQKKISELFELFSGPFFVCEVINQKIAS